MSERVTGDKIALLELMANCTSVRMPTVKHISKDKTIIRCSYLSGSKLSSSAVGLFDEGLLGTVSERRAYNEPDS